MRRPDPTVHPERSRGTSDPRGPSTPLGVNGLAMLVLLSSAGCLKGWDEGGPWACGEGSVCPEGYTCDDEVCCKPGGTPACPTLPLPGGRCAEGEPKVYFQDLDGDGDGNEKVSRVFCKAPHRFPGKPVYVLSGRDCDDTRGDIFFGAPELCNGKDDNCDRVIDEGLPNLQNFYRDEDGDGVGDTAALVPACMAPPGYSALSGDCAALDPSKFPGANEQCNNLDDDCDGTPDTGEPTFADSDGPGTNRFPCTVQGAFGVCRPGTFQCEVQGMQVQRVCRSERSSSTEVCDGLDHDCMGDVDEAPECGGPRNLVGPSRVPNTRYRAQRLTGTAMLNTSCQANLPGTAMTVSADGRTWSSVAGGSQYYHVWSAEAPGTTTWDLSKLNAQLRISFTATASPYAGAGGIWGDPSTGGALIPVVFLCGETDADFIRYRLTSGTSALKLNDTSFDQTVSLNNSSSTWLVGTGSGFDTSKVRRIEVLVFTNSTDFTITFQNTTGLP
ncbi:MAG: putative metal-binding motif-containing protein [Archangium sp.]|nr:putative metal-binding motif-containing protein [Archangium sp.]